MEGDDGAADDERVEELSSIAAIFPELILDPKSRFTATLSLSVTPTKPLRIRFQSSADSTAPSLPTPPTSTEQDDGQPSSETAKSQTLPSAVLADVHDLAHLPPLILHITLPEDYPSDAPPLVSLSSEPPWIPRFNLKTLQDDCKKLWEEWGRGQVVYTYIDHLQQAAENAFRIDDRNDIHLSSDMKLALLDFDLNSKREIFEKGTFDCGICLEPKKGTFCHRLMLCGHVFCVSCLQDFYNNCIAEGDVDNVKCLAPNCSKQGEIPGSMTSKRRKQDRTLNPSELLQIPIEQELVQRYVRLKRKRKLEADKNTIYCPRQWCQGAAKSKKHPKPIDPMNDFEEPDSDSEAEPSTDATIKTAKDKSDEIPMSERLSICEDCSFAFCSVCKKGWHGELANCNPRRLNELNAEEEASLAYLQRYSTPCPTCNAPSQKTMGCNHMICFKCHTHFCYLCSAYLMPDNPYRHFNELKSQCYQRLWELEGGDGDDAGIGIAAGAAPEWAADSDSDSGSEVGLGEDEFAGFGGDEDFEVVFEEEDSNDEEPAPDQRRPGRNVPRHIELVNAAGDRIIHLLPEHPDPAPPAAPAAPPPLRNARGRGRGRHQPQNPRRAPQGQPQPPARPVPNGRRRQPPAPQAPIQPPLPDPVARMVPEAEDDLDPNIERIRLAAAPGQGNAAAQQPAPVRWMGLERFLELAHRDQEDEWDSDELDEDIEVAPRIRNRGGGQRH